MVDDDSPDGTWRLALQKADHDTRIRLIHRTDESGLTSAISHGIHRARGLWIGWMDSDMSMPPESWLQLAEALTGGADMAVGSRYVPGGGDIAHSGVGRLFSRIINVWAGMMLNWSIKDYTSGFILGRRQIFDKIELRGDYGEYCVDLLYRTKRAGFTILEVPYLCLPRESGESKTATSVWGYLRRGVKYVVTVFRFMIRSN